MATSNSPQGQNYNYILYYHPYSVRSLQVLLTLALGGEPKIPGSEINVDLEVVDIIHGQQSDEWFLCSVNPCGQVPALGPSNKQGLALAGTLNITYFMAETYPDLLPAAQADQIKHLMQVLHSISFFSMSFADYAFFATANLGTVDERLQRPGISDQYRRALEIKRQLVVDTEVTALEPATTKAEEEKTSEFLSSLEGMVAEDKLWLFGDKPTMLDAHLVPFLARLTDIGRKHLIPTKIQEYGARAMQQPEWIKMMDGRKTMAAF